MLPYIFISYKAEEFSEAKWVKDRLEASGIPCWMAPASIPGGSNYAMQIPRAIKECKAFVLILSQKAQQSKWVPRELDQAINAGKVILPFCIDNSPLREDFAFYLSNVQRYEAWQDREGALWAMISIIRYITGARHSTGKDRQPGQPASPSQPGKYVQSGRQKPSARSASPVQSGQNTPSTRSAASSQPGGHKQPVQYERLSRSASPVQSGQNTPSTRSASPVQSGQNTPSTRSAASSQPGQHEQSGRHGQLSRSASPSQPGQHTASTQSTAHSQPVKPAAPVPPVPTVRYGGPDDSGNQEPDQGSTLKKVVAAVVIAALVILAAGLIIKLRHQNSDADSTDSSDSTVVVVPESDSSAEDENTDSDSGEDTDTDDPEPGYTEIRIIDHPETDPSDEEETVQPNSGQGWEPVQIDYNTRGTVRILNKKEDKELEFEQLASRFHQESGIKVTVETPEKGKYSDTLQEKLTGTEYDPTLFMLGGLNDFEQYGFECLELGGTAAAQELEDETYTLKGANGKIYGLACIVEAYGLAVNTRLLEKAGYQISDIQSFSDLKRVAEDITARKKELGFSAFTAPSVSPGVSGDYRFAEHAADVPLYYELKDNDFNVGMTLRGTYTDGLRDYIDLYLDNATILRGEASARTLKDAQEEFLLGKAVFHQDGSWNTDVLRSVLDYEAAVIPLYMGMPGEENQGINETFTYFWCVNKYAKEDDIEATLQFLQWLVTSEEGLRIMTKDMGFQIPYKRAKAPDDIFMKTLSHEKEQGIEPVRQYYKYGNYSSWINSLKNTIRDYADGRGNWEAVREAFTSLW